MNLLPQLHILDCYKAMIRDTLFDFHFKINRDRCLM